MDIEKLKYPVGKYNPGSIQFHQIERWIDDISQLPTELNQALLQVDEKSLSYTYRPEGWNIQQVVHHLADSHMNSIIRFKLALTEDNPTIKPYHEDRWATMHDVKNTPISASVAIIEGVHARLTSLLRGMSVQEFSKKYTHPEHGRSLDLAYTAGMYAWHGRHHVEHINNALKFQRAYWNGE